MNAKALLDQLVEIQATRSIPREAMKQRIARAFPKLWMKDSEEFDPGTRGAIWTTAEDADATASDGNRLFDAYAEDFKETTYVLGVHRQMLALLDAGGWSAEFYDPGTVLLFPG
jgi:hypothetical protein